MSIRPTNDGPTARYPGPQRAPVHTDVSGSFEALPEVRRAWIAQSGRRVRGPPVVVLEPAQGVASFTDAIRDAAEAIGPPGSAPEVTPGADGCRFNPEAIPPEATIGATVRLWRHPYAREAIAALEAEDAVSDYDLEWSPSFDRLGIHPGAVRWAEVANLDVSIELAPSAGDAALESITRALRASTVAENPSAYIVGVTRTAERVETPDGPDALFSLGFAAREELADARSRVYRAEGQDLDNALEACPDPSGIQLTVTSPPYLDAIDYDAHADAGDAADWGGRSTDGEVAAWMQVQRSIFESVFDATQEGGYCAVVIGTVKRDQDRWSPLPHHFAEVMQEVGWTFHERIIWDKVTGGAPRFGTTVQNPYPTYYYPNQQHEEIQVWRKGDIVNRRDEASKLAMSELAKQEIANNVWHVAPVPMNADVDHPCPFPEEIVHRLTLLYSCEGDVVADPMAGSGTTLKVADRLGRVAVGTEIRPEYVAEARRRLATERYERRDQLVPSFEAIDASAPAAVLQADSGVLQRSEESVRGRLNDFV